MALKGRLDKRNPNCERPCRKRIEFHTTDKDGYWTAYYINPLVIAYNSQEVIAQESPKDYSDLLRAMWKEKLVMEDQEVEWFSTILSEWGEGKGMAYMRQLAAQKFHFRHGHTLMTRLVAAGEYPGAVLLYAPQIQYTKSQGVRLTGIPPTLQSRP